MKKKTKNTLQKKKTKEEIWRADLFSGDENRISQALDQIEKNGNAAIFPDLVEFYKQNKNSKTGKRVYALICNIKDNNLVPLIFETIEKETDKAFRKDFLAVCWQSRLDFSPYLEKLTRIFIDSDLDLAFEAFTAIEYMDKIDDQMCDPGALGSIRLPTKKQGKRPPNKTRAGMP